MWSWCSLWDWLCVGPLSVCHVHRLSAALPGQSDRRSDRCETCRSTVYTTTLASYTHTHTHNEVSYRKRIAHQQGGICRGGSRGTSPSLDDLPSHWFVWKLRGNRKGEGRKSGKGRVGETTCLTPPPTGFCLKYHSAHQHSCQRNFGQGRGVVECAAFPPNSVNIGGVEQPRFA